MREIIKVKNVSKVYKINKRKSGLFGAVLNLFAPRYEKKIAVSDMNFSIEEGEAVAFIGSNGAGKSTTIKMLSGILYPSEGEITVASYVPYKQRKKYVSNIGVVLGQKSQLVWDLPVRDGYELIRHIYKISKEDYEKRLDEFIEMLDMKEFINQPVRQLSLGQKMRAEIVAAMLHNPKIIFLDEPTIGLDLVAKKKIQDFIRTINKKYGFIGRNGAGKTTCMRMIGGLAKPTSGEISMFGYAGKDLSKVRSRVGCLIEAPGVYPNMTAKENIEMKCRLFGISKKGYAEGILDKVGLLNVGKKKTKNFSLGMKQRLGIGMALVGEPDLLVLDEPINGLDPQGIAEVRDTIQNLCAQQDMTVFISSHILEELSKLATDYGIINNGALLQEITREELLSKCSEKITLTVDNPNKAVPVLDKMGFVHYMIVDKNHIDVYERLNDSAALNTALVTAGVSVAQLAVTGMELETYFLSITGGATNV